MNIVTLHEQGIEASKKALKKFLEDFKLIETFYFYL